MAQGDSTRKAFVMPEFGKWSKTQLATVHPDLRRLFEEVVKGMDCHVLCGYRNEADQDRAFNQGFSKVQWPNSKHNTYPSLAVDVSTWPLNWHDIASFDALGGFVLATAERLGIGVEWGGAWKSFVDRPHYQLKEA